MSSSLFFLCFPSGEAGSWPECVVQPFTLQFLNLTSPVPNVSRPSSARVNRSLLTKTKTKNSTITYLIYYTASLETLAAQEVSHKNSKSRGNSTNSKGAAFTLRFSKSFIWLRSFYNWLNYFSFLLFSPFFVSLNCINNLRSGKPTMLSIKTRLEEREKCFSDETSNTLRWWMTPSKSYGSTPRHNSSFLEFISHLIYHWANLHRRGRNQFIGGLLCHSTGELKTYSLETGLTFRIKSQILPPSISIAVFCFFFKLKTHKCAHVLK